MARSLMCLGGVTIAPLLLLAAYGASAQEKPQTAPRRGIERLPIERLAAAHADAARHAAARRHIAPLYGLTDYRASLHLHCEDSDHTGGTFTELLADAKQAGVSVIMLTDHYRPPRDFMNSRRGLEDGVLFIPGSEAEGFLLFPDAPVMSAVGGPKRELVAATTAGTGLIFLSHVEERMLHFMDGLTGMEIYNRHYDAYDDMDVLLGIARMMTDPKEYAQILEAIRLYHAEILATQLGYPAKYLAKWDAETPFRRLTGIAANDCHHNQVYVAKMRDARSVGIGTIFDKDDELHVITADDRPGVLEMTQGHQPGDELARVDLDTYESSFRTVCTHILAPELSEPAVRAALRAGHAYVSFDWMCDPTGFRLTATNPPAAAGTQPPHLIMGDETAFGPGIELTAAFPTPCRIRLLRNGTVVTEMTGDTLTHTAAGPGVYRVEGWLSVDGEDRIWILSNPVYLR